MDDTTFITTSTPSSADMYGKQGTRLTKIPMASPLTDSVSTTSSVIGASATAVKTAYDKAVEAYDAAEPIEFGAAPLVEGVSTLATGKLYVQYDG